MTMADLDDVLFTLDGVLDFSATLSPGALQLTVQAPHEIEGDVRQALTGLPALKAAGVDVAADVTVEHLLTHTAGLTYGFEDGSRSAYRRHGVSAGLDQPGLSMEENLRRLAVLALLDVGRNNLRDAQLAVGVAAVRVQVAAPELAGLLKRQVAHGFLSLAVSSETAVTIPCGPSWARTPRGGEPPVVRWPAAVRICVYVDGDR